MNAPRDVVLKLLIKLCKRLDKPATRYKAELAAIKAAEQKA